MCIKWSLTLNELAEEKNLPTFRPLCQELPAGSYNDGNEKQYDCSKKKARHPVSKASSAGWSLYCLSIFVL
jgi:hypothetical protein